MSGKMAYNTQIYATLPSRSGFSGLYLSILGLYILYCCYVNTDILLTLPIRNNAIIHSVLSALTLWLPVNLLAFK